MNVFQNRRIVLGISGSIACYKSVDLASKLAQAGAQVDTILTDAATKFVTPLTFQSVTGRPAYANETLWGDQAHVLHVGLGHEADLLVIVPATANTLAKLAQGNADNLLTVTALAATCPLILAPAMDGGMFTHPSTQRNLKILAEWGATIIGPEEGHLASGLVARGRMSEPQKLLGQIRYRLSRGGDLQGCKVVVTAGGTREPVDPVRFLTNRSSGKQGLALAQAALDAGADVTLITTVSKLDENYGSLTGARIEYVESALEMSAAVLEACVDADVLLMAAAVADFRPEAVAEQKIKKAGGLPTIRLTQNPDILKAVGQQRATSGSPKVVVGFAAETQDVLDHAQRKLAAKGLDMIAANDVSASDAGFAVDTNRVTLLYAQARESVGDRERLPLLSKAAVADEIIERVVEMIRDGRVMGEGC